MGRDFFKEQLEGILPDNMDRAILLGRLWMPSEEGPSPIIISEENVFDFSKVVPTVSEILNLDNPLSLIATLIKSNSLPLIGRVPDLLENTHADNRLPGLPYFLAPCDFQAVRACGVTFVSSMVERVIEEFADGNAIKSAEVRKKLTAEVGSQLNEIVPGSIAATKFKQSLISRGLWSQYLEVGIGPDAEVFNKAQPLSAVGSGAEIGIRSDSSWNNPEPELVLAINRAGKVIGVTLGNDVNLRDFEGRSALLLGKAKDNNASCSIGPFIRLFDESYTIDDARKTHIKVSIRGSDGYELEGNTDFSRISRDLLDLAGQAVNRSRQYPDGLMLFLGTDFAPTADRDIPDKGFTHKVGDIVSISNPQIGTLVNRVNFSEKVTPWTYGISDLARNLAKRKLI